MSVATISLREALRLCGPARLGDNPVERAEDCAKARRDLARRRPDLDPVTLDEQTARGLHLSLAEFQRLLSLRALGAEVRDLVADGELSVEQALPLGILAESRRQRALAREAIDAELSPAQVTAVAALLAGRPTLRVRTAVQRVLRPAGARPAPVLDPATVESTSGPIRDLAERRAV